MHYIIRYWGKDFEVADGYPNTNGDIKCNCFYNLTLKHESKNEDIEYIFPKHLIEFLIEMP